MQRAGRYCVRDWLWRAVSQPRSANAQDKIAQDQVQYQKTPKDGNKCSMCVNWDPPNACKIVAGTIDPNGWCIAYAPRILEQFQPDWNSLTDKIASKYNGLVT